jgi:cell division septum initiation protein DivIVA
MSTPPTANPDPIRRLDLATAEVAGSVSGLADRIAAAEARIAALEAQIDGLRAVSRDDLNDRIVSFLDAYVGLKFNPTSVASNMGEDAKVVAQRLLTLANQRRVARFAEAGSHPLYSSRKRVQK